jgi:hypothetical protein
MRFLNSLIIIVSVTLFSGCDSFVEDLDQSKLPEIESKLVVSCYISPQSSGVSVIVTESDPIFGPANYYGNPITNAEVVLSGNGSEIRIPFDSTKNYFVDSSAFRIEAGKTYTLTVNDGKRFVKATCTVPAKAPTKYSMSVEKLLTDYAPDSLVRIRTTWEDIRGEKNYYSLLGYFVNEMTQLDFDFKTGTAAPVRRVDRWKIEFYPYNENVFNDTNLDGATFTGPVYNGFFYQRQTVHYVDKNGVQQSFDTNPVVSEIRVDIMNMDENYYKFYRSANNSGDQDNPFVEPALIYTNVEGGLGCFCAFNAAVNIFKP